MSKWKSLQSPVSDLREWKQEHKIELTPAFQRGAVWADASKIMLIDSILNDIPIPKILIAAKIKDDSKKHRIVIDGQQRLKAILEFLADEFALVAPYEGDLKNKKFSELDLEYQHKILNYNLDFNECTEYNEDELRAVYSRFNKHNIPLNKQELRKAEFPGDFLFLSEKISKNEYIEDIKLFSISNRRRFGDVEYISELIAGLLEGIQDKKASLDAFYFKYKEMKSTSDIEKKFIAILEDMKVIFKPGEYEQKNTRFKQKSDFYSLFFAINDIIEESNSTLKSKDVSFLRKDLQTIDDLIEPQSPISLLSEYAIKCSSQANTINSRIWRTELLKCFLRGTYLNKQPSQNCLFNLQSIAADMYFMQDDPMCPPSLVTCPICLEEESYLFVDEKSFPEDKIHVLYWTEKIESFQLCNSSWAHKKCLKN